MDQKFVKVVNVKVGNTPVFLLTFEDGCTDELINEKINNEVDEYIKYLDGEGGNPSQAKIIKTLVEQNKISFEAIDDVRHFDKI